MREIHDEFNPPNGELTVLAGDELTAGGGPYKYQICYGELLVCPLTFQHGPKSEVGINGITQEALLLIIADRLRLFQEGPYKTRFNAIALTNIELAQMWLHRRTRERFARGVEGMHVV